MYEVKNYVISTATALKLPSHFPEPPEPTTQLASVRYAGLLHWSKSTSTRPMDCKRDWNVLSKSSEPLSERSDETTTGELGFGAGQKPYHYISIYIYIYTHLYAYNVLNTFFI